MNRALPIALCAALLFACSSGPKVAPRATAPLTAEEAALFTDGVDLLEKPELLQDTWREQWVEDTQKLAKEAHLIVRGLVTTVRTGQDPDQRIAIDVVLEVKEAFVGDPRGRELILRSREGALGYGSVQEHRDVLLRSEMIAFVRFALEGGREVAHFMLVRPSNPVMNAVYQRLGKRSTSRVKIVEHTQE